MDTTEVLSREVSGLFSGGSSTATNELELTKKKNILQNKVDEILKVNGIRNFNTVEEAKKEAEVMKDYVIPLGSDYNSYFRGNGHLIFEMGGDFGTDISPHFNLHKHAVSQIAERYLIPAKYIKELVFQNNDWGRSLAAEVLNSHINHVEPNRLLFRTIEDQVRGILSNKYRRINSKRILDRFVEACSKLGLEIYESHYDETKIWVEAIYPNVMAFNTPRNGVQVVNFGVRFSTSDFGDGALEIRFFMNKCWCVNGAVSASAFRRIHSGKRIPNDIMVSERTVHYDTEFHAGLVYDSMMDVLSKDSIEQKVRGIQKASANEIEFIRAIDGLPKKGMLKEEIVELINIVTNGSVNDGVEGENTVYKLSQAISAVARNKEGRRKRDLQELAGSLIL